MNKLTIPLSGITRHTDDSVSADGQCIELINARVKNGAIQPVGRPTLERAFPAGREAVYIHKNSHYEHLIAYDTGSNLSFDSLRTPNGYTSVGQTICNLPHLLEVQSVGNTLVMLATTGTHYALFKEDKYTYLGEKPDLPDIRFSLTPVAPDYRTEEYWCDINPAIDSGYDGLHSLNPESVRLVNDSFRGAIHKALSEVSADGKAIYPLVVRYALRLFDGSYLMHSAPLLVAPETLRTVHIDVTHAAIFDDCFTDFTYRVRIRHSRMEHTDIGITALKQWKDVISSIDLFVSAPIATLDLESEVKSYTQHPGEQFSFALNYHTNPALIRKVEESSHFFKIRSYPIDIPEDNIPSNYILDFKIPTNLEQADALPDDPFSRNHLSARAAYVYNSRLHLANLSTLLAPMYPLDSFVATGTTFGVAPAGNLPDATYHTEVHIKSDTGTKVIHGQSRLSRRYINNSLSPYLSYPDARAYRLVIYFDSAGTNYHRMFTLKPHPLLNTAYCLDALAPIQLADFTPTRYNPVPEDRVELSPNKIKVSEVNNPFYFPARLTYTVSNRAIVGMAAATTALSTGQFGQFPLYVFAQDGIYALATGTGEVVYTGAFSVSRDCCTNPRSIVSTDSAILFATNGGLILLQGSEVQKLSHHLEGYLPSCVDSSAVISKIADIPKLKRALSRTEFLYFLEGAVIGYSYAEGEVIVSNPDQAYSYVLNLASGEWHKTDSAAKRFLNSYPQCLALLRDNGLYDMHNPHRTVNNVLLITRPVKFGTHTHKRILQSAIRGVVRPSLGDVYLRGEPVLFRDQPVELFSNCGFYVLGSNDAEHFTLLSGREKLVDVRDLITKMNKTQAYKYFMFCLCGGVRTDVSLNLVEVMIDDTYSNRLR